MGALPRPMATVSGHASDAVALGNRLCVVCVNRLAGARGCGADVALPSCHATGAAVLSGQS